jgi:hypothetical protein
MRIKGNTIYLTRGDSAAITITCEDQDGDDRDFQVGDTVYFTVKKSTRTAEKVFQKVITSFTPDGEAVAEIIPSDTSSLHYGTYYYDIQLTTVEGKKITLIPVSEFEVEEEVTYE